MTFNPFGTENNEPPAPKKLWTDEVVDKAKESSLPVFAQQIAEEIGLEVDDVVDAIGAALLSLTAEECDSDEATRNALKPIVFEYAQSIGIEWETYADAIVGSLHWTKPNSKNWSMPDWR
jgi:hypothetical protein